MLLGTISICSRQRIYFIRDFFFIPTLRLAKVIVSPWNWPFTITARLSKFHTDQFRARLPKCFEDIKQLFSNMRSRLSALEISL